MYLFCYLHVQNWYSCIIALICLWYSAYSLDILLVSFDWTAVLMQDIEKLCYSCVIYIYRYIFSTVSCSSNANILGRLSYNYIYVIAVYMGFVWCLKFGSSTCKKSLHTTIYSIKYFDISSCVAFVGVWVCVHVHVCACLWICAGITVGCFFVPPTHYALEGTSISIWHAIMIKW